ncbi:hypothetical protein CTAYLR_003295 [Chrysophaeum taylorii]|uniref:FHA domain-containing protein n=1 Tax=Chrysophaeum taylorii TaxID=2483200 RepID=A0AAD7UI89_9STRA|nr:hypothetical protein CTAYLR_003295 [Chrysophaeum taylorii]
MERTTTTARARRLATARAAMEANREAVAQQEREGYCDPFKAKLSYSVSRMLAEDEVCEKDEKAIVGLIDGPLAPGHSCGVWADDRMYPSVEHALQALKAPPEERAGIAEADVREAKRLGAAALRKNPEFREKSVSVMDALLRDKFLRHPSLRAALRETGTKRLVHLNDYGDAFWGEVPYGEKMRRGKNELGKALERVRSLTEEQLLKAWLRDRCDIEDVRNASLEVTWRRRGGESSEVVRVLEEEEAKVCVVGRAGNIVIDHPSSSRQHAALVVREKRVWVIDLESTHGTFLDGVRLEPLVPRAVDGAELRFGGSSRRYRARLVTDLAKRKQGDLYAKIATTAAVEPHSSSNFFVVVENVPYEATVRDLERIFPGAVDFEIEGGRGVVRFTTSREATLAVASDRDEIDGRRIRVFLPHQKKKKQRIS